MNHLLLALDFGGTKLSAALFAVNEESAPEEKREDTRTPRRKDGISPLASSRLSGLLAKKLGFFFQETALFKPETEFLNLAREPLSALALNSVSLLDLRRVVTPANADATHELATMISLAGELLDGRQPVAVGVSFGGPVDYKQGIVRLSHHVRGWENFPLRDAVESKFGCRAAVDNDANAAALGEQRFGAGRGVADLMYVTVSTGVGGGWVLGGRPWRGHDGMAGEIGHTVVDPAGPVCLCGKRGCVERLASGPYMAADYEEKKGRKGEGEKGGGEAGPMTGQDVAEAAASGDETARAILLRGAGALGAGIGNAANLINPRRFILGGGVTKSGEAWWAEVRRAARATTLPEIQFDIVPAELGDDAPLWGAVAMIEEK